MTKPDDQQPITSVINTGELMRQLAQREADHRRRVQSWSVGQVQELTGGAELLDIALHHENFDVAVAALSNDHMSAGDRSYVAVSATDQRVRDAAQAEAVRRGEHSDGPG